MNRVWLLLLILPLLASCTSGPDPVYLGPEGDGPLRYDPDRGIVRTNSLPNQDEESLWGAAEKAWQEKRYGDTIRITRRISEYHTEGRRVVDAILLRIKARIAAGLAKHQDVAGALTYEQKFFVYLAPNWDPRIQALQSGDDQVREDLAKERNKAFGHFIDDIRPTANVLYDSGQLVAAIRDVRLLATYYVSALSLETLRTQVSETGRNLAWWVFAAGNYDLCIELAKDMLAFNPSPSIKADVLFIQAHAQRENDADGIAANTFALLWDGEYLRDTETRWRPAGLFWWIEQILEVSKGPIYDLALYERCIELLGEYELYLETNPWVSTSLRRGFIEQVKRVYDIMIFRQQNAATTYDKLSEHEAADYYRDKAKEWEEARDERIRALKGLGQ